MGAGVRLIALLVLALSLAACGSGGPPAEGDRDSGRLLLRQYGCGHCHTIPGVADARGNVGPPLAGIGTRVYLAGILPNSRENMMRWIAAPKSVDPLTTMPDLGVPEAHVRDMVAYLAGLR